MARARARAAAARAAAAVQRGLRRRRRRRRAGGGGAGGGEALAPPSSTLRYPPLARLLNAWLPALNQLRPCAPHAAAPRLRAHLEASCLAVADALLAFEREYKPPPAKDGRASAAEGDERGIGAALCAEAAQHVLPHACACFEAVFAADDASAAPNALLLSLNRALEEKGFGVAPPASAAPPAVIAPEPASALSRPLRVTLSISACPPGRL